MTSENEPKTSAVKAHRRVLTLRPVTFTCAECGREYTVDRATGRPPIICLNCWPEYRKRKKTEAQRQRRVQKRTEG